MRKKLLFLSMALLAAALLSGCAGGPVRGTTWPGLAADDNAAYLVDGPYVYAIDLQDGKELWRYPAASDNDFVFYSTPVVTPDGLVIVGSSGTNHGLIALNPSDVNQNDNNTNSPGVAWTFNEAKDQWVAAPLVVDEKVFAVNSDGYLYVLNLADGQSTKKAVKAIRIGGRLWAKPTTDGERVFLTSLDHSVIAVDMETYEVLWNQEIRGAVAGSAVLGTDGMLYVGSFASQLEKIDPANGKREPVLEAENWIWSTPSQDGDTLYFADLNGNLYSFNTSTGKLNWPAIKPGGPITASPLTQNDQILIATESGPLATEPGSLIAIDRDGNVLWSQEVGDNAKVYTTPVASGDLILVAPLGTEFYLAALDQNGRQVWTFTPGN